MNRSKALRGAFVLYDTLRVDWRQYFAREDAKLVSEDRLTEAINAHRVLELEANEQGKSEDLSAKTTDEIQDGLASAVRIAITCTPKANATVIGKSTTTTAAEGVVRSDRLIRAVSHVSAYMRIALEDTAMIETIPRRIGKILSLPEANELSQLFTEVHSVENFTKLLVHLTNDLGQPITSKHFHDLLRLFIFGRDKSCCDRTLAAIIQKGFVSEETFARMIDAHHIFQKPREATRNALQVIHLQSIGRSMSLVVPASLTEKGTGALYSETTTTTVNNEPQSSTTDLSTSHTLSSLLHLLSTGSHHSLLSMVTVVWMRALGVELTNWDWAHVTQALATKPHDYVLVKGIMEAIESPPQKSDSEKPLAESVSSRRLAPGYVSVQSLLYCIHRRGVISDGAYTRLRTLVRDTNTTLSQASANLGTALSTESIVESLMANLKPRKSNTATPVVKMSQTADDERIDRMLGLTNTTGAQPKKDPLGASSLPVAERVFARYDTSEGRKFMETEASERPQFFDSLPGLPPSVSSAGSDAMMPYSETTIHLSLPIELEALLSAMIQNLAVESVLRTSNTSKIGAIASATSDPNAFVKSMKEPIYVGFLNRRFASPTAMILSTLEQAVTQRHSVGPYRENGAHLYHHYSLMLSTMKNDVEAVKMLTEAERVGKIWHRLYSPAQSKPKPAAPSTDETDEATAEPTTQSKPTEQASAPPTGNNFLLSNAMAIINKHHNVDSAKGKSPTLSEAGLKELQDLARLVFTPRTSPAGSPKVPITETSAVQLLGCPFVISHHFLFDVAMIFPNIPLTAGSSAANTYIASAMNLIDSSVTLIDTKTEGQQKDELESSETIKDSVDTEPASELSMNHNLHTYPLLTANDKGFLSAYSMYFIRTTADAKAAWETVEPVLMHHRLPPRSTKKKVKIYAEICARHPPRNCKLTQKGFEERMRWALYLEARETALMLYGSGKEAKDMMKHLYYNQNKLPVVRDADKVAEDEQRILPFLPQNPISNVTAAQLKTEAERRNTAAVLSDKLQRLACYDAASFVSTTKVTKPQEAANEEATKATPDKKTAPAAPAAELQASLDRSSYFSPTRSLSTRLEEVAESVLVAGPHSRLPAPQASAVSSSTSAAAQITEDGRLLEPFATEASWIHGYQPGLVPYHLYREDVFNHFPHTVMSNSGSVSGDTVSVVPPLVDGLSSSAMAVGIEGKRLALHPYSDAVGSLASSVAAQTPSALQASAAKAHEALQEVPTKKSFVYENDGFTEDPFVPLWMYVNHVFSTMENANDRPWLFEDTEMFLLILRCLIYRLDWENAAKFTLLFIQPSSKPQQSEKQRLRIAGFAEALSKATGVAGADASEDTSSNSMPDSWTFALDHATAKMFADIGDPQGFLPFKAATKLFDGKLVNKSNRMGRVQVKPLMEAAGMDTKEGVTKKRFV